MSKILWNCLSGLSQQWVQEWNDKSLVRRHLRYSRIDRFLRNAGEHPAGFLLDIGGATLLLTGLVWLVFWQFLALPIPALIQSEANLLTYFSALWTIQATLAALVYPIVISFVAVLLRRRATATLGLRIYSLDAGVVPSGSSSIALVGWMALQYFAMPFVAASVMTAGMVGNLAWFILNVLLTSRFLYRTIQFMNDDDRLEVFKRFAVHVAFPRDLHSYLMGNILQTAQKRRLLPGRSYVSDEAGPKVLLHPMSVGSSSVQLSVRGQKEVVDIRLRPLGWAIWLWLRSVRHEAPERSIAGLASQYPVLQFAVYPGQLVEGRFTICRTSSAKKLNWITSYLLRISIVLGPRAGRDTSFSTSDILEEIAVEALELIEQQRYEAASGTLITLTEVHDILIRSGAFTNDANERDNAALMPDPYGLATRRLHELWLDSYNELARLAVNTLTSSSRPFEHHCYVARRLAISLRNEHIDILVQLLHIPSYLLFRLGTWWSEKVEERGCLLHDHIHGAEIPYPLGRIYEHAVESFIGNWEQLDLWESPDEHEESKGVWASQALRGRFATKHLDRTLYFLLEAVSRGDEIAALWFADSLLKWWSSRHFRFGEVDRYDFQDAYTNAACLAKDWGTVTAQIAGTPDGDEAINATDLVATVLHRYWLDSRMLGVLILLSWIPGDAPNEALSKRVAIALIKGRALKGGGDAASDPIQLQQLAMQLLRMQLIDDGYTSMFDRTVREARELRRGRMIPGRVYDASGADDLQSLMSSQALLLTSLASPRAPFPIIEDLEELWSGDLRRSENAERFARQLKAAFEEDGYKQRRSIATAIRNELNSPGSLSEVEGRITRTLARMADRVLSRRNTMVAAAPISQVRLDHLGQELSEYILSASSEIFPFVLKPVLRAGPYVANPGNVTFSGARKVPYTEHLLEQRGGSESFSYRDIVVSRIAGGIIGDTVRKNGVTALRSDSESNFIEDLRSASNALRTKGLTPLLLLPQYQTPECARPWRYVRRQRAGETDVLVRMRRSDDPRGVTSLFLEVPAYNAPIANACFVVAREWFTRLGYAPFVESSCVGVSATIRTGDTIDLRLEWMFEAF